jgi:hypothetical protein
LSIELPLSERLDVDFNQWVHDEFDPRSHQLYESFKKVSGEPFTQKFLDLLNSGDGFCFDVGTSKVGYFETDCRFFDCYRAYLWLEDDLGNVTWRVRVPIMYVPVYPYIVDDRAIFIGVWDGDQVLTIVDIRDGTINDRWPIPGSGDFNMLNPTWAYPYFNNGSIVLPSGVDETPATGGVVGKSYYRLLETVVVETTLRD